MRRDVESPDKNDGDDRAGPIRDNGDDGYGIAELRDDAIVTASSQ